MGNGKSVIANFPLPIIFVSAFNTFLSQNPAPSTTQNNLYRVQSFSFVWFRLFPSIAALTSFRCTISLYHFWWHPTDNRPWNILDKLS